MAGKGPQGAEGYKLDHPTIVEEPLPWRGTKRQIADCPTGQTFSRAIQPVIRHHPFFFSCTTWFPLTLYSLSLLYLPHTLPFYVI